MFHYYFVLFILFHLFSSGCDTGFGHEAALELNKEGFTVFAACLFPDRQAARSLLVSAKNAQRMHLLAIDVTNDLTVRLALEEVEKVLQSNPKVKLWAVVNNAGVCPYGEVEWGSFDQVKKTLEVNALGQVLVTRTFLPLIRQCKGRIVNINSGASRVSVPGMVPYCMSKFASLAFTEGLRRELFKFGVKVISIEPLFHKTPMCNVKMIEGLLEKSWKETDPEIKSAYGSKYYKRMLKQITAISLFTEEKLTIVTDAIKESVMNSRPSYHYFASNWWHRMFYTISMYITPQESCENGFKLFSVLNGRSTPFPDLID